MVDKHRSLLESVTTWSGEVIDDNNSESYRSCSWDAHFSAIETLHRPQVEPIIVDTRISQTPAFMVTSDVLHWLAVLKSFSYQQTFFFFSLSPFSK